MEPIIVGMADCRIAQEPGQVLATYALGSCIGLALHDSKAFVGGLLHFMLPDSGIDPDRARANPFLFADTGIPLLLRQLYESGASRRHVKVHAIGGARMLDDGGMFDIGKRNYLAARRILWKAGLMLDGEAVGGANSRTVRLEVGSGRIWLYEAGAQHELQPASAPKGGNQWHTGF